MVFILFIYLYIYDCSDFSIGLLFLTGL